MANRALSSLRAEVYTRLAESGSGFYTDAEINQWLTDGVRDVSVTVEPLETTATVTTVTSTQEYLLPQDTLSIRRADYLGTNSVWYALTETTWQSLYQRDPDWINATTGAPEQWYWRQANVIGVTPAPSATYAGAAKLRILYTYLPAAMSGDTSVTGLPEWLDDTVVLFAVYRGYLKDRDFQRAQATSQEYSRGVSEGSIKLNRQRKQSAPRLVPDMGPYRTYWSRGRRSGIIRVQDS